MGYGDALLSVFNDFTVTGLLMYGWHFYDVALYGMLAPVIILFCAFLVYQKSYNMLAAYPILVIFLWIVTQAAFKPFSTIAFFIVTLLLTYGFYKIIRGD